MEAARLLEQKSIELATSQPEDAEVFRMYWKIGATLRRVAKLYEGGADSVKDVVNLGKELNTNLNELATYVSDLDIDEEHEYAKQLADLTMINLALATAVKNTVAEYGGDYDE